ncbi:hypothetical protein EDB81DRAFT_782424 [Dactylonectria macrodidyma]|uniref:Uncharacterized protein n=1 Tax=Dactylonectria macrodidyma TaxID=307937 RepID=A0A9P9FMS4_9HYPO|nr:hypothetical protein EDB81DRAFT_782424 [Dactylonectria macrodidyma]
MADKPNDASMLNSITSTDNAKSRPLDEKGSVGKQFTEHGAIGGTAQMLGGPFDKDGLIGKQFTTEGSIGGTVQSAAGGQKK